MPEWLIDLAEGLAGLHQSTLTLLLGVITASAALGGALLGAITGYVFRELEELLRRERERKGLLTLVDLETRHNAELLRDYEKNKEWITDQSRGTLSTRAWDDTRVRLSQLLKDTELFSELAKYYEEMRRIGTYSRGENISRDMRIMTVAQRLPDLEKTSNAVRRLLNKNLKRSSSKTGSQVQKGVGNEPLTATLRVQAYLGGGRCVDPVVTEGRCADLAVTRSAGAAELTPSTSLRCCCARRVSQTSSTTRRKTSFASLTVGSPSLGSGRI
jgi:hypothetical protein